MKSKRLFVAIGGIDDKFISEDAEIPATSKETETVRLSPILKFAAPLAACMVIAIGVFFGQNGQFIPPDGSGDSGLFAPPSSTADNPSDSSPATPITPGVDDTTPSVSSTTPAITNDAVRQVAYGFAIGDKLYSTISFDERRKFGLVPQEDWGSTLDNYYVITEKDLGDILGFVESSQDESLVGATIYHYAAFPDSYAICIVDRGERVSAPDRRETQTTEGSEGGWGSENRYEFYTFHSIMSLDGASSDTILTAYGMTMNEISHAEILASDQSPIRIISDEAEIAALLDVLQGYENIGLAAHEEMMVNWLTDYDHGWRDNDNRFAELQQRWLRLGCKDTGIELSFIYNPFIQSLCTNNSFYILTEDDAAIMNTLLMVNQ